MPPLRKIKPFKLLGGAKLEKDPKGGQVVRGALEIRKGFEIVMDASSTSVTFRAIVGDEISGRFLCKCFKDPASGKCQLTARKKGNGTVMECKPAEGSKCKNCGLGIILDQEDVVIA